MRGFSQENMADMVGISRQAYGDIERGIKEPSEDRLTQIAEKLGLSKKDLDAFENTISNFFDQCNTPQVNTGTNNHSHTFTNNNNYSQRELQNQIEKLQLEKKLLQAEKEKAEIEARYWREKSGAITHE